MEATMWNPVRTLLCCFTLCAGLAVTSADASETRVFSFHLPCTGDTQVVFLDATSLGPAATRFVQGSEIAIIDNPNALQYLFLRALSGSNSTFLTLGVGQRHAFHDYTGFFSLPNVSGTVSFGLFGACSGGGLVTGIVVIQFFS